MSKAKFVKGLAAGAVLGAVAALIIKMENKSEKLADLQKSALKIKDKVAKHALAMGKLSKAAYHEIVDKTVEEYRGLKSLSDKELVELRADLKGSWTEVESLMKNKPKAPSKK